MSATERDIKFGVVVADYERQPEWMQSLVELTGKSCDDVVVLMLTSEMELAANNFMRKFPELFQTGSSLI